MYRSSHPEVFLGKTVPKICSKFTEKHPCRSVVSIKLQSNLIKTTLQHECSPVNLLHIFRTPFPQNTSGWLLLYVVAILRMFALILLGCCSLHQLIQTDLIQRRPLPEAMPTKLLYKPVKKRHFSKKREETHRKQEVCFSYSSEIIFQKISLTSKTGR